MLHAAFILIMHRQWPWSEYDERQEKRKKALLSLIDKAIAHACCSDFRLRLKIDRRVKEVGSCSQIRIVM